ncbi:collagen alpha-1(XII) chain-like [Eucyclogobius newberryi]|uniref:collagen alpha-1(XII) chain-like n=1 Tax=Eucyclogobius newberryi TaxID=166745 RepID=UPI003B5C7EA4
MRHRIQFSSEAASALIFLENGFAEGIKNLYSLSLVTYALCLTKSPNANAALNDLLRSANITDGVPMWLHRGTDPGMSPKPLSSDLESVGYLLLALHRLDRTTEGVLLAQWLSRQQNGHGGFGSTQDTVVALQALSVYAALDSGLEPDLSVVQNDGSGTESSFTINKNNRRLLHRTLRIGRCDNISASVKVMGRGLLLFQVNVVYNELPDQSMRRKRFSEQDEGFALYVTTSESNLHHLLHHMLYLTVCFRLAAWSPLDSTGMALLEVHLLTGFSLQPQTSFDPKLIKKVETNSTSGQLFLYIDSVTQELLCVRIPLIQEFKVGQVKDGSVQLYDYYQPSRRAVTSYSSKSSICTSCSDNSTHRARATPMHHHDHHDYHEYHDYYNYSYYHDYYNYHDHHDHPTTPADYHDHHDNHHDDHTQDEYYDYNSHDHHDDGHKDIFASVASVFDGPCDRWKMRCLWAGLVALLLLSLAQAQTAEPVSGLKFQILSESSVQVSWTRPRSRVQGFRLTLSSDTDEELQEVALPPSASSTSLTSLRPGEDYTVSIVALTGAGESAAATGKITLQARGGSTETSRRPPSTDVVKCSAGAAVDVVLLLDVSRGSDQAKLKHVKSLFSAIAGAFTIGAEQTRLGVASFAYRQNSEFSLSAHASRPALLKALARLAPKGLGRQARTGAALSFARLNSFTPQSGSRSGFPKVLVMLTDGPSQTQVQDEAQALKNQGVEIFVVGVQGADEAQMKLVASSPHTNHMFSVSSYETLRSVQRNLLLNICAAVEEQLSALASGSDVVEPALNLDIVEVSSKSLGVRWEPSPSDVSGYRLQVVPVSSGGSRQELYVSSQTTSALLKDLSPQTAYEVHLYALKDMTSSQATSASALTLPLQVSVECSLGVDVQADLLLLVDGSYSIGLANFAKVRAFLEVLVKSFDIGPDKVQMSLVQYSRDPHPEFYLNTHQDLDSVLKAIRTFPYRGGSTNTGRALTYVRERVLLTSRGARTQVPTVTILITDGKSSDAFRGPASRLQASDVEVFAVGVKDAVRSELEAIASDPPQTHVFEVEDFDAFQKISRELSQSICLRIEQELSRLQQQQLGAPRSLSFSEVTSRSMRASWAIDTPNVESFLVKFRPAPEGDAAAHYVSVSVPGHTKSAVLPHLSPLTPYQVQVHAQYQRGESAALSGEETTLEDLYL